MGQSCNVGTPPVEGGFSLPARPKAYGHAAAGGGTAPDYIATPRLGGWGGSSARKSEEPHVPIGVDAFQLSVSPAQDSNAYREYRSTWRSMYALGPMLGDGVSAKVYEAEALTPPSGQVTIEGLGAVVWGNCGGKPPCMTERGRRVAIKRFHRVGSRTFKKELSALLSVGVHPHILRLLESYEGCDGEDVLVLEYCDGSTVYDLYAREHPHGGLPERMICRMMRQLLLALEHLCSCSVEHQDVKPENMMLHDVSLTNQQAELKLGDFGWAMVVPPNLASTHKPPSTGAGSLWYAPPELNPPVKGIPQEPEASVDASGRTVLGRSDMWSVGVVVYLLLVGHNPFNSALKLQNQDAIDGEVLRLAALGHFNRKADKWMRLSVDAKDFICSLLKVRPSQRPSASEALHHPYLTRRLNKNVEASVFFHGPVTNWADRDAAWARLDGLQQLGWVAIARAVSEPELDRQAISAALEGVRAAAASSSSSQKISEPREATYLYQLARELGTSPVAQWLQERSAWAEVLRLAFSFLDVDCDGVLSARDIASHLVVVSTGRAGNEVTPTSETLASACRWISRWQGAGESRLESQASQGEESENTSEGTGIGMACFRAVLLSSQANDNIFEAFEAPLASAAPVDYFMEEENNDVHPSFSRVTAGPHDHEEEEICWTDLMARGAQGS